MDYLVKDTDMTVVADAIRTKGGTSDPLTFPDGMAQAVEAIKTGGGGNPKQIVADYVAGDSANLDVTLLTKVYPYALAGREVPTVLDLQNCTAIYGNSFADLAVDKIVFSKFVTADSTKGYKFFTFNGCTAKTIDFYSGYTNSKVAFFFYGAKTTAFIFRGKEVIPMLNDDFGTTEVSKKNGFIYVPKVLVEQYKVATNWVKYANQIRAIEDWPEITGGAK